MGYKIKGLVKMPLAHLRGKHMHKEGHHAEMKLAKAFKASKFSFK